MNHKLECSKKHRPYSFSAEPEVFDPIMKKIEALAIEQRASRSFIIARIILDYFNVENNCERPYDYSKRIRSKT